MLFKTDIFRSLTNLRKAAVTYLLLFESLTGLVIQLGLICGQVLAGTEDLGDGFLHHGVAAPVSIQRGVICTRDRTGRDVVLVFLFDYRGGYALLMVDGETGQSEEIPMPFPPGGDSPYSSLLSSQGKLYTHFNSHFCEFDLLQRRFTFKQVTSPKAAMGMTEDDNGVIWSVTYPASGVVSFDPKTREFRDFGSVNKQNWAQYQRSVAADDQGWIYFAIGSAASQIVALNPKTGQAAQKLPMDISIQGATAMVYRDVNGKVYGTAGGPDARKHWYEFYNGVATALDNEPVVHKKPIITGTQDLVYGQFPSGRRLVSFDMVKRMMITENPATKERRTLQFEYSSEGAPIMALVAGLGGTIYGGTAFPMRFFSYTPKTDQWIRHESYDQWNTMVLQDDRLFVGGYPRGFLLEWNPQQEWISTLKDKEGCNPRYLVDATPDINRPHELLAYPDGKTVVLAGTPSYGNTGGGLLFWDRVAEKGTLRKHNELLPHQSTLSLVALPEGKLLGGSTILPGTGGEVKAKEAELYILDMAKKTIDWHKTVLPGVTGYTGLCNGPRGLTYGLADQRRFFVFDPTKQELVYEADLSGKVGPAISGPRGFVKGPNGAVYILYVQGICQVNPEDFTVSTVVTSPVPISAGGDMLEGRIYFASGSHVYSWGK